MKAIDMNSAKISSVDLKLNGKTSMEVQTFSLFLFLSFFLSFFSFFLFCRTGIESLFLLTPSLCNKAIKITYTCIYSGLFSHKICPYLKEGERSETCFLFMENIMPPGISEP